MTDAELAQAAEALARKWLVVSRLGIVPAGAHEAERRDFQVYVMDPSDPDEFCGLGEITSRARAEESREMLIPMLVKLILEAQAEVQP